MILAMFTVDAEVKTMYCRVVRQVQLRSLFPVLAGLFLLVLSPPLWSLNSQELSRITLLNDTGHNISKVFYSPKDSLRWGPDILGTKDFPYGTESSFYVHYEGDSASFDLLAIDEHGDMYLLESVIVKDGSRNAAIFGIRNRTKAYRQLVVAHIYLTNATNRVVSYLFFAPDDSNNWGFDILDDSTSLQSGASLLFSIPVGSNPAIFEILAISKDKTVVQRRVSLSSANTEVFLDITLADLQ